MSVDDTLLMMIFNAGGNRPTQMEGRRQRFNDLSDEDEICSLRVRGLKTRVAQGWKSKD